MSKLYHRPLIRCALLFSNFFLIITALYHLKPVSRSIFLGTVGSDALPYVWIATALLLGIIVSFYYRLVARFSRLHVVISTIVIVIALLVAFRPLLVTPAAATAFAFYIFVDILSVILVEQFWSITNAVYSEAEGRRWYAYIGTGGLVGGVVGGFAAGGLVRQAGIDTVDLLLVAAAILLLLILLTLLLYRAGLYGSGHSEQNGYHVEEGSWRAILKHRYLRLIAVIVLLAQIIEPLIEFQFMNAIEAAVPGREERTAYLGEFFGLLGLVAIAVNLLLVPLVHRWLGVMAGLAAQPLAVVVSSLFYLSAPGLSAGAALKIADRGLSYSINRASKELLYASVNPLLIFQAKAWIDMFGYRLFRIAGSLMILLLTQWLAITVSNLSWLVLLICIVWGISLLQLRREHNRQLLAGGGD